MSGGVDSSVAAALLKRRGLAVTGIYIKCYNLDGCAERDAEDARRVAEQLGIPFYVFDLEKEYKERVVQYMVDEYLSGRTPNPDVMCNKEIKFGLFLKRALELGADYVATGHYLRLKASTNNESITNKRIFVNSQKIRYSLMTAKDQNKDQSYFLWTLTQNKLKHCLFPIGDYTKPQVRAMAQKWDLVTADKKDSQGICFLGKVTLADFLKQYIPEKKGLVLNVAGQSIGQHRGSHFYTIGQRHGLGLGGFREPLYVADKNIKTNTVVVAERKDNPAFYQREIELKDVNFINISTSQVNISTSQVHKLRVPVLARVRYRQPLAPATLNFTTYDVVKLIFEKPQKFVAPGQSVVFYSKDGELLGGGIIK